MCETYESVILLLSSTVLGTGSCARYSRTERFLDCRESLRVCFHRFLEWLQNRISSRVVHIINILFTSCTFYNIKYNCFFFNFLIIFVFFLFYSNIGRSKYTKCRRIRKIRLTTSYKKKKKIPKRIVTQKSEIKNNLLYNFHYISSVVYPGQYFRYNMSNLY